MARISSKAVLKALTPYKANGGCQFEDEGSLDYYNTFYRKYDAQIGRFTGIDIKAESFAGLSPFQFGNNNPVFYNDPMGDKFVNIKPADPMANTFAWALNYRSSIVDDNPSMKIQSMWDNIMSGGGGGGGGGVTAYKDMTSFSGETAKAVFAALLGQHESDEVDIQVDFGDGGSILGISSTFYPDPTTESPDPSVSGSDGTNTPHPVPLHADLVEWEGLIEEVTYAWVGKPPTVQDFTGKNRMETWSFAISGERYNVLTLLPATSVEIRFDYFITQIHTITDNGKVTYTNSQTYEQSLIGTFYAVPLIPH